MIEGKLGILDLLDEESRLPSGADASFITKLYQRFGGADQKFFQKPRFGEKEFLIKHYALDVTYQVEGFIEKNKDSVSDEQMAMLNDSQFDFLKEVIKIEVPDEPAPTSGRGGPARGGGFKKPTLGHIFKGSLIKLMDTLRQTNPHFIRCIKPNQAKMAFEFEPQNVLGQLVACGVLETIKISRAGYPSKQTYDEFNNRYYFLSHSSEWKSDARKLSEKIVRSVIKGDNKYEFGLTKIFFRAGQLAFLEKVRSEKFTAIVVLLQKNAIRHYHQKRYKKMRVAAVKIQKMWRGYAARKLVTAMRQTASVIKLQTFWRRYIARKKYKRIRRGIIFLQRAWRKYVYRRDYQFNERDRSAAKIQATWRMYRAKKAYKKTMHDIVVAQSCWRRRKARLEFKQLKVEARSVGKLKETNYKLESKLFELSQGLDDKKKENVELLSRVSTLEEQLHVWKEKYHKLETEAKSKGSENQEESAELRKQVHAANDAKEAMIKENEKLHGMIKKRDDNVHNLQNDLDAANNEIKRLKEEIKNAPKAEDEGKVAALKKEVTSLKEQMGRLVAGKYRTDLVTEKFLNNDSAPKKVVTPAPQPAPGYQATAASAAMSFFESAAQVTARVAGTLGGTGAGASSNLNLASLSVNDLSKRNTMSPDDSAPKDRPIRMLEAHDLTDEVIDSLITNLRIPLPSTQTVASRKEIFFPAHLLGYLMSQFLEYRLVDKMRELIGQSMKGELHKLFLIFSISCSSIDNEIRR